MEAKTPPKLRRNNPYEAEDPLETLLHQSFTDLQTQLNPPYSLSIPSPEQYSHLNQALLYAILTQESQAQRHVTYLKAIVTDGYAAFVRLIIRLANESYPKLLDPVRRQLIWVFRQLVELSAVDAENLCLCLLRRISGGDFAQGNAWLALELLHVLNNNWVWVTTHQGLLTGALFTYLRLLPDHSKLKSPLLNVLKKTEIEFCVRVLRERFQDCMLIGKDLVRLLHEISSLPEFEAIWRDLLTNPRVFRVPGFVDISQLYLKRTPGRYLVSRLTPEMETQVRFMLTNVRWGNQRRYQAWFANKYFVAPESETLICDLIRFICCCHHPPNEVLQSDVITRWAIIGWLLKCCRSNHVEANAKLALFYDWLFFAKSDNIMNIEPAMLLMVHSIPKYVEISQALLEFLLLLVENYDPPRREIFRLGVCTSFEMLVGKGVVLSMEPLLNCNLFAPWLREKLATFVASAYCKVDQGTIEISGKKTTVVANEGNGKVVVFGTQTSGKNSIQIDHCNTKRIGKRKIEVANEDNRKPTLFAYQTSAQKSVQIDDCIVQNGKKTTEAINEHNRKSVIFGSQISGPNFVQIVDCCAERMGNNATEVIIKDISNSVLFGSRTLDKNSISSECQAGDYSRATKLRKIDSCEIRSDITSTVQNKRLLVDDVAGSVQMKRMHTDYSKKMFMNNLLEAFKRSYSAAVDVLEKNLLLFLGISNHAVDSSIGGCSSLTSSFLDFSPEIVACLALEIANAFKASGHEMFSPLWCAMDDLGCDEMISTTAVILRIYTLCQNSKLQDMLLIWHKAGLPVGAHLLCYASRLANELEIILEMRHINKNYSLNHHNLGDDLACLDGLESMEQCGLTDMNKTAMNDRINKQSLLEWHAEKYTLSASGREASFGCIQSIGNVAVKQLCMMVEDAFRSYREFLLFSTSILPTALNSHQSKIVLVECLDDVSSKHEPNAKQNPDVWPANSKSITNINVAAAFLKDLSTLCLWNISRMQQVFRSIFRYIPDLSTGNEGVIRLLVCFMVPAELLKFEFKLGLKDFSVFGEDPQNLCTLMKSSLELDHTEQQNFWRLLTSELQVCEVPLILTLLTFSADNLNPSVHAGALSGLLMFLRFQSPSAEVLNAMLCLPKRLAKFAASVITSWLFSKCSELVLCFREWTNVCLNSIQGPNEMTSFSLEKLNVDAVKELVHFLKRHEMNETAGSKSSSLREIRFNLLKLVGFREMVLTNNRPNGETR